jgi:hypothetical protein
MIRKISPLIRDSLGVTSHDSTGSSEISSAKTSDFLDFAETKSKSFLHLQFWPSFLHLPYEIKLRYPCLPQSPIYLQYAQVFHTKNSQEALTRISPSILQKIFSQEALH